MFTFATTVRYCSSGLQLLMFFFLVCWSPPSHQNYYTSVARVKNAFTQSPPICATAAAYAGTAHVHAAVGRNALFVTHYGYLFQLESCFTEIPLLLPLFCSRSCIAASLPVRVIVFHWAKVVQHTTHERTFHPYAGRSFSRELVRPGCNWFYVPACLPVPRLTNGAFSSIRHRELYGSRALLPSKEEQKKKQRTIKPARCESLPLAGIALSTANAFPRLYWYEKKGEKAWK